MVELCVSADCALYFGATHVSTQDNGTHTMDFSGSGNYNDEEVTGFYGGMHEKEVNAFREKNKSECDSFACKFTLATFSNKTTGEQIPHSEAYEKLKETQRQFVTPNAIVIGDFLQFGEANADLCANSPPNY